MRKYRAAHPEQKRKAREYMKAKREREYIEGNIMCHYMELMELSVSRDEFAKLCIECLDELGYDTGNLWNVTHNS